MSWGTCYSASNNIHNDLPPLMSDKRNYTNYETSCRLNKNIIEENKIKSNFDYRKYLTNNASELMKTNGVAACNSVGNCNFNTEINRRFTHYNKYLYKSCDDNTQPYGYESSDLKNMYLNREALQSRLIAPLMSQQGYLLRESKGFM
jgi:hypothetical protein